jgi:hypothetical protein
MKSTATKRTIGGESAPYNITAGTVPPSAAERLDAIAAAAYYKAEARGFSPGQELGDWLQAEAECGVVGKGQ